MSCKKQIFIVIFLVLFRALSYSQSQDFQFAHITVEDGLSNNSVNCILQDRQGFMWFSTEEGLNKFDGYRFTAYKHIPENTGSISANYIWHLFEDSEGFIWVGTGNGLNKFDPLTEKFSHYFHDDQRVESLSSNDVTCLIEDRDGYIWIGTGRGLNRFDRKTQTFKHFMHEPNNPASISLDYISCLFEDSRGDLWIGTGSITAATSGGINKFDRRTEKFMSCKFEPSRHGHANWITDIDEDAAGNLWIGTDAGLHKYNIETNTFTRHYEYHGSSISSLARNTIKSVFIDSKDNLWVGSWGGGLSLLDKITGEFIQYKNNPQDIYSLSNNKVLSIYEDRNGCLWVGTKGGGINTINPFSNFFRHYKKYISQDRLQQVFEVNNIRSVYQDRSGRLWLGSEGEVNVLDRSASANKWSTILSLGGGTQVNSIIEDEAGIFWIGSARGLIKYDPVKKQERWYTLYEPESPSKSASFVYTILIDQTGLLWIGTQQGLYRFDRKNDSYTRFVHDREQMNTLSDNRVFSILENRFGILWVGTVYGLNKFDPGNQTFLNFQVDAQILAHLKYNDIRVMCEDQLGNLWIGTAYGLKMYNQATEDFHLFTQKDGLPDNVINGLLSDDNGNIWISTNSELSEFNPGTKEFKTYDYSDGIQNTAFNSGACFRSKAGEMLFGGNNGLTAFYPNSIKKDMSEPPIVITGFKKFNEEVQLDTAISQIKQLTLSFDENVFSFEFAALNFINPPQNQFAYKMEGFIDDWIHLGNKHEINFTNLSPGKYVFRVKGSNHDAVWNEEGTSLKVIITPPWWKTWWAYALYVTFLALTLYLLHLYDLRRQRLKHQLELEHIHAEKLEELDRVKSHFFANISHEFRTPLTLILGPLEKLIAEACEIDLKQQYQVMRRSGQRLLNLINELLDISKLESGSMTLRASCQDIVSLLRRIVNSFISLAERKHLTLAFKPAEEAILAYVDPDKLEKIMNNLLSNAFKFTPEGGEISVQLSVNRNQLSVNSDQLSGKQLVTDHWLLITVKDTGIGILTDKIDKIFNRFYQVDASQTRGYGGTGIGLALAKELVELHHGDISVASEKGMGTTFIVRLPLGKAHLAPEEIVETPSLESAPEEPSAEWEEIIAPETGTEAQRAKRMKSAPILLVVEDNADMRAYLCSLLSPVYRVIESVDGQDGLEKALRTIPDLIISDVMMPQMDGFELCAKLKTDERTSHIPVILLTARASAESRIAGLETGADDYIAKPFAARELQVRVKNLIDQRRKLRERFRQEAALQPHVMAVTSTDEKFLQKAIAVVEKRMSEDDFNVEIFGREVGMSRAQLHRKLRALTDHSAREFIRTLRLARAAQLFAQHGGNVTEVAYEVGFKSLSHFAKCFHQQFGVSPSAYATGSSKTAPDEQTDT